MKKETHSKFCYMCEYFIKSPASSGGRICMIIKKHCLPNHLACEDFNQGKLFYCLKRNQWNDMKTCFHIRKTKKANCGSQHHSPESYNIVYQTCTNNCQQGKQIESLFTNNTNRKKINRRPNKINRRKST